MSFEQIKFGDVIKHRKGFITIDDKKEYKLCRVQLHRRGVVLREVVNGSSIRTKKQQVCKAGDFLVAEMDAKVGGYGFVPNELDGAIVSSHYFLFELDESKIRPKYLEVVSQLKILQDQIKAVGSTNYAAIRPSNVLNWEIPITDIEKQKEIEELYDLTRLVGTELSNEFSHQQDLLTQLRESFLREAMQGKLVKQDPKDGDARELWEKIKVEKAKLGKKEKGLPPIKSEEIPFEIPENWVWCRLGEVGETNIGLTYKPSQVKEIGVPVLRANNIQNHKIDYSDLIHVDTKIRENQFAKKGDILLCVRSGSSNLIGKSAIIEKEGMSFGAFMSIYRSSLNPYIFYFTMSNFFKKQIDDKKSTGINQLTQEVLKNIILPLPPPLEQTRIVKKLDGLMKLCDELEDGLQVSREQNELLLQQVLKEALRGTSDL